MSDLDREQVRQIEEMLRRAADETNPVVRNRLRTEAYNLARDYVYPRIARKFWNHVGETSSLARMFRRAGLTLRRDRVPAWILDNQAEVRLSLEHMQRVSDNPARAADPSNLHIVPLAENVDLLEDIRRIGFFDNLAEGRPVGTPEQ